MRVSLHEPGFGASRFKLPSVSSKNPTGRKKWHPGVERRGGSVGVVPLSCKGNKIWRKGGFLIGLGDDVEQPRHLYANEALQLLRSLVWDKLYLYIYIYFLGGLSGCSSHGGHSRIPMEHQQRTSHCVWRSHV